MEDLSDLKASEDPRTDYDGFSSVFYSLGDLKKNKLIKAFQKYFGITFIMAGVLATVSNLLQFSGPLMISSILGFLNTSDGPDAEPLSNGIIYVSILIGCYLLRTVIFGHAMHFVNMSCTKVLNSANSMVFHKILSLSSASRKYLDVGSIMTHINVDIMSFYYFIMMSTFVFSAPIMIIVAMVLLVVQVGWIGLTAPVLFGFGMILQNKITKKGF
jgi:ATP-binding cassette, subfamily C (CFTR/MRP), member 10